MDESPNSRNRNVEFTVFFFKFEFITRGSWASGIFKFARIWDAAKNLDDFQRRSSTTFVGAKGGGGGGWEIWEKEGSRFPSSPEIRSFDTRHAGGSGHAEIQDQIARNAALLRMHSASRAMHKKRQRILPFHANARIDRAKARPCSPDRPTTHARRLLQIAKWSEECDT